MAAGILALAAAGLTAVLTPADEVRVDGLDVRLSDVALVSPTAGDPVIARLPRAGAVRQVSRVQLQALIRRTIPAIAVGGRLDGDLMIRSEALASSGGSGARCFEIVAPVPAGEAVIAADAEHVDCDPGRRALPVAFDRETGGAVAVLPLKAGSYLGAIRLSQAPAVRRGQPLILVSRAGPVVIERPVTALQSVRPTDQRVFVRTSDDEIVSAPVQEPWQ